MLALSHCRGLTHNKLHIESTGQYENDSLLTCTVSQLVTMVMNEGGRKHAALNTNAFCR